jgi:phage terminase Nu1 subunit (DNA packaging protein)
LASNGQTFSLNETAALLGVTRQSVDRWMKAGCPYVERADPRTGKQWQLSLPDVVAWREKRAVEAAVGDTSKLDLEEAKRRKTAAEAALAELELAKRRGDVVAIADVVAVIGDQFTACRARLLSVAHKTGPLVAPVTDTVECVTLIDQSIREALDELAGYDGRGEGVIAGGAGLGFDNVSTGADEAAPEADGERMGRQVPPTVSRSKRGAGSVDYRPE